MFTRHNPTTGGAASTIIGAMGLLALALDAQAQSVSFTTAGPFAVGSRPHSVAVGEFNGDGKPDFAVASTSYASNNVFVLLGDGTGGVISSHDISFESLDPYFVAVGDFNGDGRQDLAVTHFFAARVSVLLGDGSGGFALSGTWVTGNGPTSVAVGDFNADGKQDLVVANAGNGVDAVTVLLGNGAGGFTSAPGSPFPAGTNPWGVAVGDLDGDGKPDLAVTNAGSGAVTVLLGDGAAGFTAAPGSPFPTGLSPYAVVVSDVNGDGKPDLAVANSGGATGSVTVLHGNGTGGFTAAAGSPFSVGLNPRSLAAGDFNVDGTPDLVVGDFGGAYGNPSSVTLLLGNGSRGFAATTLPLPIGSSPDSVAVGDFNADGKPDFAVTTWGDGKLTLFLNTTVNSPPVADAGPDQMVTTGSTVQLNGAGATDVDGNPLTYLWSFVGRPAGSAAGLSNALVVNPTFVADKPGAYVVQLIVNDGLVNSAPDTVSVSTVNSPPVLTGFAPGSGEIGRGVTLTGTAFTGTTGVSFHGVSAVYAVVSDTEVRATVPAGTTTGPVRLTTPGGTATSATDFQVTNQRAARAMPGCYVPGYGVTVSLDVGPAPEVLTQALADTPPTGWTVGTISDGGAWDAPTSQVNWGTFSDATARLLTYVVAPPAEATGTVTFAGVARFDGVEVPLGGTATLDRCEQHPADANSDFRLVIGEVTGYGAAWKRGNTWAVPPLPIPIGYVTRAGYLWRAGETYRRELGDCPSCWMPLTPLPLPDALLSLEDIPAPRSGPWSPGSFEIVRSPGALAPGASAPSDPWSPGSCEICAARRALTARMWR